MHRGKAEAEARLEEDGEADAQTAAGGEDHDEDHEDHDDHDDCVEDQDGEDI